MKTKLFNRVYDLLVKIGGAPEAYRDSFVHHHTKENCEEFRFCGKLGFGGKFRSGSFTVNCYQEDSTPEREAVIKKLNEELAKLKKWKFFLT